MALFDKSERNDGTFCLSDFRFDADADSYTCPAGKELVQFRRTYATPEPASKPKAHSLYRASKMDCDICKLKAQCCPNAVARKIPRDLHEDARDVARAPPQRRNMRWPVAGGKKSRCCSRISSVYCASGVCDCGGHTEPRTNSSSRRPRKICDDLPD